MSKALSTIPIERIEAAIYLVRGEKVMLDRDLAALCDVSTKALNQAVKRNKARFPDDFMIKLTAAEARKLNRSQSVTGSQKHRNLTISALRLHRARDSDVIERFEQRSRGIGQH